MRTLFRCLILALPLIIPVNALAGETRTWTSADGRTVEAEFVRVDGESVEIKTDRGLFRLTLAKLSPEDQEFVRQQSAAAERKKPLPIEDREWTMRDGKVKARFVRIRDGNVQLRRGDRILKQPVLTLSPEDTIYIHDLLESRGELEKLKDDPFVKGIVELAKVYRRSQELSEQKVASAEPAPASNPLAEASVPATEPDASIPEQLQVPPESAPHPMPTIATTPMENVIASVPAGQTATAPPSVPAVSPTAANSPAHSGLGSNDPWERDQAIMTASNRAAYYWLAGIFGLLVIFGPIIYALQRAR